LSARPRGSEALGFYKEASAHVPIERIRLASDLPEAERPRFEVLRSDSPAFSDYVTGRANRGGSFFDLPAGGVDLCNVNVPVRRKPG
jgi:peptidylprolyl isomerase